MVFKIMEDLQKEAVLNRDKEMIAKKLRKNWSPERIHQDDEYPMELILEVQEALLAPAK